MAEKRPDKGSSQSNSTNPASPHAAGPFSLKRRAGEESPRVRFDPEPLPIPQSTSNLLPSHIQASSATLQRPALSLDSSSPFRDPNLLQRPKNAIPSSSRSAPSLPNGLPRPRPSPNVSSASTKGKGKAVVQFLSSDDVELVGDIRPQGSTSRAGGPKDNALDSPSRKGKGKWPTASESDLDILLDNPDFRYNPPPSSTADDDDEPLIFIEVPRDPIPSTSTSTASSSKQTSTTTAPESLANLCCPICLGPPTPLAMTICGHAFCGGCLHESLASGPELTPPPELRHAYGFGPGTGGSGAGGGRGSGGGRRGGRMGGGDGELDARCPVCRTILRGGWSKSLRGIIIRMAVVED